MSWLDRRIWPIVLAVALVHVLAFLLAQYGLPKWGPRKSDITIELGATLPRGSGSAQGRQAAASASKQPARTSAVRDELATRQARAKSDSAAPSNAAQTAATGDKALGTPNASTPATPGVDSAPTVDADYKAAYLNNPKPPYPQLAFQMRIEGTVMLKALVLPDGACGEVLLARSSGNELLDKSALATVAQWKFTPAKSQGKDIAQWVGIPITFSLKRR